MLTRKELLRGASVAWDNMLDLANQRDDLRVALQACERLLTRTIGTEEVWSKQLELDFSSKEEETIEEIEAKIIELNTKGKDG